MITGVAIKDCNDKVWSLPKPNRHGHIFIDNKAKGIDNAPLRAGVQGFINDKGEFLDRQAASIEASANKQILPPHDPSDSSKRRWDLEPSKPPFELFSEDLW